MTKESKIAAPADAPAQKPDGEVASEGLKQLQHLIADLVESFHDGCTTYRIRAGRELMFSNFVGACVRLLDAHPVAATADASVAEPVVLTGGACDVVAIQVRERGLGIDVLSTEGGAEALATFARPPAPAAEVAEPVGHVYSFTDLGCTVDYVSPQKYRPPVGAPLYAHPPAPEDAKDAAPDALLNGLANAVEELKEDGFWRSCSGCHELNEGHDTGPRSAALGCALGGGCSECGGLGAVWDQSNYSGMVAALSQGGSQS